MNSKVIIIEDNTERFATELEIAVYRALTRCGEMAVGYAKDLCPMSENSGDASLRQSIEYKINKNDVYIGTNKEYGPYVELGTGKYYPGGRPEPWNYEDENGDWHHTEGQEAQPYLVPAAKDHAQTYRNIFKDELGT